MSHDADYQKKLIADQLIGATITGIVEDPDASEFFGFVAKNGQWEHVVWVNCDAEGNGPGWLDLSTFG